MSEWKDSFSSGSLRDRFGSAGSGFLDAGLRIARANRVAIVVAIQFFADGVITYLSIRFAELIAALIGSPVRHTSALALIIALTVCFLCLGLYTGSGPTPFERFRLRMIGFAMITGAVLIALLPTDTILGVFAAVTSFAMAITFLGFYAEQFIRRMLVKQGLWSARTLLIGPRADVLTLAEALLRNDTSFGLRPVCALITDRDGSTAASDFPIPQIGSLKDVTHASVEMIVFTSSRDLMEHQAAEPGVLAQYRTLVCDTLLDKHRLWQPTRDLGIGQGREISCVAALARSRKAKRAFDLLVAVPAAVLTAPIILVAGLLIFCVDPGRIIYVQTRVGLKGRAVRIFKLRTMYQDADVRLERLLAEDPAAREEWHRFFKLRNDPRILPVIGNFLRASSIDELPQLWNVVRGDISLVGPRPFPAYHLNSFPSDFQTVRASVPPGITGLWQVSSRSDGDLEVQKQQDTQYIQNWSIWLDIYLMFQTFGAVLGGRGAR